MKSTDDKKQSAGSQQVADALVKNKKGKTSFWTLLKKHSTLFLLLTGVLVAFIFFYWNDFEVKREKESIVQSATNQLDANNQEMLKLMTKPLAWSIRADMMRGNLEQIDLLILDLIKERNFQFIHLVAPNGNVVLSTNKSYEGKSIDNKIDASLLVVRSEVVVVEMDSVLYVAAPIFGVDKQIATLLIGYKPTKLDFEVK